MKGYANDKIKKITLCSTVLSLALAGGIFSISAPHLAQAESAQIAQTAPTDELISPTSYEQYLDLTAPTDVAVNERYTAISDGNSIFIYDSVENLYREYTHEDYKIAKMQFSDGGALYFADETAKLYQLNPQTVTLYSAEPLLHCSSFALSGNDIYFSIVAGSKSNLFKAELTDLENETMLETPEILSDTVFSVCNEEIFYTHSGQFLLKYPSVGDPTVAFFQNALTSTISTPACLYCTDVTGNFYAYDFIDLYAQKGNAQPVFQAEGNFSKLALFDGYVYAIDGSSVRQFSIQNEEFTDFEICSSSASENRLSGATDLILHDGKLITADHTNKRISIKNPDGSYTLISTEKELRDEQPKTITATGNTVMLSVECAAYLYDLTSGEFLKKFDFGENKLAGVTGVYGKYYFVTNANAYYVAAQETADLGNGSTQTYFSLATPVTKSGASPTYLTSDIYGNLFVARAGNLYKYDEQGFLDKENAGKLLGAIPATTKKISVDYNENVYIQTTDEKLIRFENGTWTESELTLDKSRVYAPSVTLSSFAFGVEENATYLLFNGNFITKTTSFNLPTVKTIPVHDLADNLFGAQSAEFAVVETHPNALLVEIDFNALNGATYFPYLSIERSETARTALELGKTQVFCNTENGVKSYRLLAEYDQAKNGYRTYLVLYADCDTLEESAYMTRFDETQIGYLTNDVHLYKFPYLTSLLTIATLEKNQTVTLLGEITQLDHDYYLVSIQTSDGEKHGYLPKAYVTDFDGSTPTPNEHLIEDSPAETDMIWRLAYIVCGLLAICVLTDYLILRKKPTDKSDE